MIFDDASISFPGRIVKYYPEEQLADIQISAERAFSSSEELNSLAKRSIIKNVPVHTPSGGGWALTVPIKSGDTCLILFSQVGYDHWLYEDKDTGGTIAGNPVPWLRRKFSVNDGFAIVGFNTIPRAIQSYHPTHSQWRNVDVTQVISLNDDNSITITSPVSVTINAPSVVVNCTDAEVNASNDINLDAGETLTATARFLSFIGTDSSTMHGDFSMTGTLTLNGVVVNDHIHDGDSGGTTGVMR